MTSDHASQTINRLRLQQASLAKFGSFAFKQTDLLTILTEAARICATSLGVPFCKICRYRAAENDLLIEAGCGWDVGVVGRVVSQADETSPQGRAYVTREPVIIRDIRDANNLALPDFYPQHGIISTVDVVIAALDGTPYGVLEIDSPTLHQYDEYDINFLTGFANVLAEAVATAERNRVMQALLNQQRLLAEELQHRVRNNLQVVSGMLESLARTTQDRSARDGVGSISRRVTTLAQIYDSLLGVGLSDTIDLSFYLRELCMSLPAMQEERAADVSLSCGAQLVMLPLSDVTALGLAVAELVTNSYRHAFPGGRGAINVTLVHSLDTARAILGVHDNGIGIATDPENSRRGLGLVRSLVAQIGGTIKLENESGARWSIDFPVAAGSLFEAA